MKRYLLLLLALSACTGGAGSGSPASPVSQASSPVAVPSPSTPVALPRPNTGQELVRTDDGRCDQAPEGPAQLVFLQPLGTAAAPVDLYENQNVSVRLPSQAGMTTVRLSRRGVLRLLDIPTPGNQVQSLLVEHPGTVELSAASGGGQKFSRTFVAHC